MAITSPPPTSVSTSSDYPEGAQRSSTVRERTFNIAVWILFTALWAAFFATLLTSQGTLSDLWHQIRDLPLVVQGVLWLLFLPLMAGGAIWDASWPSVVRLILIVGIAGFNVYLFFPWKGGTK
jgi:hypothetical protein